MRAEKNRHVTEGGPMYKRTFWSQLVVIAVALAGLLGCGGRAVENVSDLGGVDRATADDRRSGQDVVVPTDVNMRADRGTPQDTSSPNGRPIVSGDRVSDVTLPTDRGSCNAQRLASLGETYVISELGVAPAAMGLDINHD